MTEQTTETTATVEEPHGTEAEVDTTDWKAEARKWEKRAKENSSAAAELAAIKESQMTEIEKANLRAAEAEAKAAQLEAEKQRAEAAREIAKSEGVPIELLDYCADEDAMRNFAAAYKEKQPTVHAASASSTHPLNNTSGGKLSNREVFAQFAAENLRF